MPTEQPTWTPPEGERTDAGPRGGTTRSRDDVPANGMERRGGVVEPAARSQPVRGGAHA